jgi:hypothetical protein
VSPPWRPLLSGEPAARALAAAQDIAAATAGGVVHHPAGLDAEGAEVWENALSGGRAGQCLLHAYLALHGVGDAHADTAIDLLDQASAAAAELRMSSSLYLGFPGIAWAGAHLAGRIFAEEEDGSSEVDEILLRALAGASREGPYNLFNGLVGLGVYACERLPRPTAVRCLEAIVAQLAGRAQHSSDLVAVAGGSCTYVTGSGGSDGTHRVCCI